MRVLVLEKIFAAGAGNRPALYPEFLRTSLFNSAEIVLKFLMVRRKKLARPRKARMSLVAWGWGQFLMISVLALPGLIP